MAAVIIILLIAIFRILLRHAMFDELKRSIQQPRDDQQNTYKRTPPKPKVSPLLAILDEANQTVKASPRNPKAYSDRGAAYILLKQFDEALADLDRAIRLNPTCADAFNNRAVLRYRQNDFESAFNDLSKATFYESKDAFYYLNRSTVYKKREDYRNAEADIETALDLNLKLVDTADKANLKQHVVDENIIWNRQLARMVFLKTELMFVKYNNREYLDKTIVD